MIKEATQKALKYKDSKYTINPGETAAKEVIVSTDTASDFSEELIIRRELSDNFCYYNKNYDNPEGFPEWAGKTLQMYFVIFSKVFLATKSPCKNP